MISQIKKNSLVWEADAFPTLQNGDIVVFRNKEIAVSVDKWFVFKTYGYMNHSDYRKGKYIDSKDNEMRNGFDIVKVYRGENSMFDIVNDAEYLIWEE